MPTPIPWSTLASIESTADLDVKRLLLFRAAGRLCACDLSVVREIVAARVATRLPGAPAWVMGLINVRGTLLTVMDLAVRFGAPRSADGVGSVIVVAGGGKLFGLRVDSVRDVRAVADAALEPVDDQRNADGVVRALVPAGVVGDESALVCDMDAIAREALAG